MVLSEHDNLSERHVGASEFEAVALGEDPTVTRLRVKATGAGNTLTVTHSFSALFGVFLLHGKYF